MDGEDEASSSGSSLVPLANSELIPGGSKPLKSTLNQPDLYILHLPPHQFTDHQCHNFVQTFWRELSFPFHRLHQLTLLCDSIITNCEHSIARAYQ
jgi:hypothetical protein